MGFVSYLEDIRDRFNDSLKGADLALKRVEKTSNEQIDQRLHQLRLFISEAQSFMKQLESLVDLATDPQVQLADEILEVRERLRRTQVKMDLKWGIEESLRRAQDDAKVWKSKCLDERQERKAEKERANRLEGDVLVMVRASRLAEVALRKHRGSNGQSKVRSSPS